MKVPIPLDGYTQLTFDRLVISKANPPLGERLGNLVTRLSILILCLGLVCGCKPKQGATSQLSFDVTLVPSPPKVGPTQVSIAVNDATGKPVEGAKMRVEGNMNHAGMKPSLADLQEKQPGIYSGTLDFTMGGDWFLLITTTTKAGTKTEHKFDVPGVQSK